tara:strand:- start:493 stop:984 length:492 start_codon:yes stop_codon:yes gene_type:complete
MSLISVDNSLIVNEILAIDDSPKVVTIEETHGNIVTVQANNAPSIVSISGASLSSQGVLNLPFKVKNNNIGIGPGNGNLPTLIDPQFPLQVSGSFFATIVSSSQVQISGDNVNDLFLVKLEGENKLIINAEGVTVLGQFNITPTATAGGLFYSSSNDFFLGFG